MPGHKTKEVLVMDANTSQERVTTDIVIDAANTPHDFVVHTPDDVIPVMRKIPPQPETLNLSHNERALRILANIIARDLIRRQSSRPPASMTNKSEQKEGERT